MALRLIGQRQLMVALVGILLLFLDACSHYKSEFSCKGYTDNALCLSATEVYARRHENLSEPQSDNHETAGGSASTGKSTRNDRVAAIAGQTENFMGQPNITQPQVLQIWIAPWRDAKNNLHEASVLYVKVLEGDWTYGRRPRQIERSSSGTNTFTPHLSQPMFEARTGKPGPNGGAPMFTTPPAQPAISAPAPHVNPATSSDPSAILRQLQQNMPPASGPIPNGTSAGGSTSSAAGDEYDDPRDRMMEQQERQMYP